MTRIFTLILVFAAVAHAEPPQKTNRLTRPTVHVPDGGVVLFGNGLKFPASAGRLEWTAQTPEGQRYGISHKNLHLEITIGKDGRVDATATRRFRENDWSGLQEKYPELAQSVSQFPETTQKDARVLLTVEIETKHQAANLEEFSQKHPELCKIYHRYKPRRSPKIGAATISLLKQTTPGIVIGEEEEFLQTGYDSAANPSKD